MKKISLIICLIFSLCVTPVLAKTNKNDSQKRIEYMNLSFWNKFNDEALLNNLMTVYEKNHDLKAAVLKVNQAKRVVKMSFANELPHVAFEGYAGRIFRSSDQVFGALSIPDYTESHFMFPLTMNYEVDIWGENRLRTKAKQKEFEMIQQDERAAYILIASSFAGWYYNLVQIDKLIEYQGQLVKLQEQVVKSFEKCYELGTATLSDVEKAKKEYTFYKEKYISLDGKRDAIMNQLNLLLGNNNFTPVTRGKYEDINIDIVIPESVDFDAMANRPDRIKAELNLKKIGIDVKVARRDLLPKFIITGNLGFNFYNLSSVHKFLADVGVVPVWDIFMGGRKIQMLKLKKDAYDIAIEHYEKTLLVSFQETDDALFYLKTLAKVKTAVDERLASDLREMEYVKLKEDAGIADDIDLLLQEERLIITKQQEVSAQISKIISAINLYQALGGIDYTTTTKSTEKL